MSRLDARLQAVLDLIPAGSFLLDVGTDHCKLPAEGLRSGKLARAAASDLREGPLAAARKQLAFQGLEIPLFLSDGLAAIPPEITEAVTAVSAAGMGGETIRAIMERSPKEPPLWILQPMTAYYDLSDWLAANGYACEKGVIARERGKFYLAVTARKTGAPHPADYYAPFRGSPLLSAFLEKERARLETARAGLRQSRESLPEREAETERLLKMIGEEQG